MIEYFHNTTGVLATTGSLDAEKNIAQVAVRGLLLFVRMFGGY
jgi:hypothetical protein